MEKLGEQVKAIALAITDLSERTLQIGDIISHGEGRGRAVQPAGAQRLHRGGARRASTAAASRWWPRRCAPWRSSRAWPRTRCAALLGEVQKGTSAAVAATERGQPARAQAAMELAQSAGSTILGLAEVIRESSGAARQIAGNTRQQTIGVEQIAAAMGELTVRHG